MRSKGFTFIEMLVVITIISVLTLVGVTNFRVANQKSRDGRRKGDLEQIRAALELYRSDEDVYPPEVVFGGDIVGLISGSTYMKNVPDDPLPEYKYFYTRLSGGSRYRLCASLELDTSGSCTGDCGTGISCNYKTNSPL